MRCPLRLKLKATLATYGKMAMTDATRVALSTLTAARPPHRGPTSPFHQPTDARGDGRDAARVLGSYA